MHSTRRIQVSRGTRSRERTHVDCTARVTITSCTFARRVNIHQLLCLFRYFFLPGRWVGLSVLAQADVSSPSLRPRHPPRPPSYPTPAGKAQTVPVKREWAVGVEDGMQLTLMSTSSATKRIQPNIKQHFPRYCCPPRIINSFPALPCTMLCGRAGGGVVVKPASQGSGSRPTRNERGKNATLHTHRIAPYRDTRATVFPVEQKLP